MRRLIHDLKFHADFPCARLLGMLMAEYIVGLPRQPECVIPVPLHPSRYRERGFNQAIEIARHVAKRTEIRLDLNACVRTRPTPPQSMLSAKERRTNLRHAFEVVKPPAVRRIALIDDVITTGATVNELATALKQTGIEHVDVWACARA
ncbi:MAG: ComF family protein [Pseudomonadota bacterium]